MHAYDRCAHAHTRTNKDVLLHHGKFILPCLGVGGGGVTSPKIPDVHTKLAALAVLQKVAKLQELQFVVTKLYDLCTLGS